MERKGVVVEHFLLMNYVLPHLFGSYYCALMLIFVGVKLYKKREWVLCNPIKSFKLYFIPIDRSSPIPNPLACRVIEKNVPDYLSQRQ